MKNELMYCREGNFSQLIISHFKYTFGLNIRTVIIFFVLYNNSEKKFVNLNFVNMSIYENRIHTKKMSYSSPTV